MKSLRAFYMIRFTLCMHVCHVVLIYNGKKHEYHKDKMRKKTKRLSYLLR
jgi:hypothetical protein